MEIGISENAVIRISRNGCLLLFPETPTLRVLTSSIPNLSFLYKIYVYTKGERRFNAMRFFSRLLIGIVYRYRAYTKLLFQICNVGMSVNFYYSYPYVVQMWQLYIQLLVFVSNGYKNI